MAGTVSIAPDGFIRLSSVKSNKRSLSKTFAEMVEEKLALEEGLITSYGADALVTRVIKQYGESILFIENVPLFSGHKPKRRLGHPNTVTFVLALQTDQSDLIKTADLYGYFVVREEKYTLGSGQKGTLLQLEPKYPTRYSLSEFHGCRFFHTTLTKHADRIETRGLLPRDSETSFPHPGNRVYLSVTNDFRYVPVMVRNLAKNKRVGTEDTVTFEINPKSLEKQDLFIDEAVAHKPGVYYAVFVLKGIYPEFLRKIDTYDTQSLSSLNKDVEL